MIDATRYLRAKAKGRARLLKTATGYAVAWKRRDPDTDDELPEEIHEVAIAELQTVARDLADARRDILTVIAEMQTL